MRQTPPFARMIISGPAIACQVLDNLWIGSAPPVGDVVGRYFDCLALCAYEYQPTCFFDVEVVRACLDDQDRPMTSEEMLQAAKVTSQVIEWLNQGLRVLVSCYAGRNRSGLICALVLMYGYGIKADKAIEIIRKARNENALSNQHFVSFLQQIEVFRIQVA